MGQNPKQHLSHRQHVGVPGKVLILQPTAQAHNETLLQNAGGSPPGGCVERSQKDTMSDSPYPRLICTVESGELKFMKEERD